ncbi:MAG: aldo/keto reductase, partial [Firmicutes bacterium]|nr:aldo/keto reductase [Bacillota bacterium]
MQYRGFGQTGFNISALGFGGLRLPIVDKQSRKVDENEVAKMLHYAVEHGVNYIDTAYDYHDGYSETVIGKVLKQMNYRSRVKIATKQPCWLIREPGDPDKYLNEQLKKLQTEQIDFYLLHGLYSERWELVKRFQVLEWAEKAIRQGKIGHLGFSFHDSYEVFKEIVDGYDQWDFCQIQYNYMNENVQAGKRGLEYAAKNGLAVTIMEPLLGGALANPPKPISNIFAEYGINPVDLALRWLWDKPEVTCVLSGMSSLEQVKQNIEIANRSSINNLTEIENEVIGRVREAYGQNNPVPCTRCRYCMPCPNMVDIPFILELYSEAIVYGKYDMSRS